MASRRIRRTKSLVGYIKATNVDLSSLKGRNNTRSIAATAIDGNAFAEEVEIVDKSIQSANYLPGENGWKIDGSGSAEFGNVFVRGDINAETGTIGYWNISSPAISRSFGSTTLFGTFLESSDLGYSDIDITSGSYVSLFKSYVDTPTAVDSITVLSDKVTIRAVGHNFLVGDKVFIVFEDSAYSEYQSEVYVVVTESTDETFSYEKPVPDNAEGANDIEETLLAGSAELYNEDIAGLYLRDYGKIDFDYGYFSNKGVAYVSATRINLIHNPSFEYFDLVTNADTGEVVYGENFSSEAGWTYTGSVSTFDPRLLSNANTASPPTAALSAVGGALYSGTTTDSEYLQATVNTAAAKEYNLFENKRTLYFDFDAYFYKSKKNPITLASFAANTSTVTVTTTGAHGLVANDLVYFAADVYSGPNYYTRRSGSIAANPTDYSFKVKSAPTSTTFTYDNPTGVAISGGVTTISTAKTVSAYTYKRSGTTVTIVTGDSAGNGIPHHLVVGDIINVSSTDNTELESSIILPSGVPTANIVVTAVTDEKTFTYTCFTSGTIAETVASDTNIVLAGVNAYKTFYPTMDLEEVVIQLGEDTGALIGLSDVIDSYDASIWHTKRFRQIDSDVFMGKTLKSYSATNNDLPALRSIDSSPIRVSFEKLEAKYLSLNSAGYAANENIYILFPAWIYGNNLDGTMTGTQIVSTASYTTGYILDDVHLSTSTDYFYGNSGSDVASWYDSASAPNTPSLKTPYKWIDIDLTTQSAEYAVDSIVFQNTGFSRPMFNKPGIFKADFNKYSMINSGLYSLTNDFSSLRFSGGEYEYTKKDRTKSVSQTSYLDNIVGENSTGIDLIARRDEINNTTGVRSNIKKAYLNLWAQEDIDTTATLYADVVTLSGAEYAKVITKNLDINVNNSTFISANSTSLSASAAGGTLSLLAATSGDITTTDGLTIYGPSAGVSSVGTLQIYGTSNSTLLGTNSPLIRIGHGNTAMLFDINSIQVANTVTLAGATMTLNAEGGNVYVAGTLTSSTGSGDTYIGGADGALYNKLTYSQAVTGRAVIVTSGGLFGTTSSSRETKQDISNLSLDIDSILSIAPVSFKYKRDVANLGEDAPTDWGMIAEDLHDAGLTKFVYYGENGEVEGIDYARYVVALQMVVRDLAARLSTLENK